MEQSYHSNTKVCFVVFVFVVSFLENLSSVYPQNLSKNQSHFDQESTWLAPKRKPLSSLVFVRTMEDLLDATVSQPQSVCQVQGRIQGDASLVHSIGIYSNDYRVVLYESEIAPDGTFSVLNVLPGTYRAAPLPKGREKLLFKPPMGHLISCGEAKTFTAEFSVQGLKMQPNQRCVENGFRNLNQEQLDLKKREQGNQSQARWSKYKRRELVLRVLKGYKSYEEVAHEHDLRVEQIKEWRDQFLLNAEKALQREE